MPGDTISTGKVLSAVAAGLGAVAPVVPAGPWRVVLAALSGVAELLAGLLERGIEPHEAIAVWRSAQGSKTKIDQEIDELLAGRKPA